jgi:hypothetical protein
VRSGAASSSVAASSSRTPHCGGTTASMYSRCQTVFAFALSNGCRPEASPALRNDGSDNRTSGAVPAPVT